MRLGINLLSACLVLGGCATAPAIPSLDGTTWRLVSFQSNDDATGTLQASEPDRYTIAFGKDGRLAAKLDCNRGMGPWKAVSGSDGTGSIALGPIATTRAMCPLDPIGARLSADLGSLSSYRLRDARLYTNLPADAGVYVWERVAP